MSKFKRIIVWGMIERRDGEKLRSKIENRKMKRLGENMKERKIMRRGKKKKNEWRNERNRW